MKRIAIVMGVAILAGFLLLPNYQSSAQTFIEFSDPSVSINTVNATITWTTNITTTSEVRYGTTSRNLTETAVSSNGSGTSHSVNLKNLAVDTTYYYQLFATDLEGTEANNSELRFKTSSTEIRSVCVCAKCMTSNKAIIVRVTNKAAWTYNVKFGTSPDALDRESSKLELEAGAGGSTVHHFVFDDLQPNTTYYYQVIVERGQWYEEYDGPVSSEILSLTTTGVPIIDSINPSSGPAGTEITINGSNFGNESDLGDFGRLVAIGCQIEANSPFITACKTNITSWNDTTITALIDDKSTNGRIYIAKYVYTTSRGAYNVFTIQGPEFTVRGNVPSNVPPINYVTNAFGCNYSTSVSDKENVRVDTLFTDGSSSDKYLENVYNAYYDTWRRYPRCDELQFHLDHSTPLERLQSWLNDNVPISAADDSLPSNVSAIVFNEVDGRIVSDEANILSFTDQEAIQFKGKTQPGALVTLLISSEHTIIAETVSDDNGDWVYTMPGPLEVGNHTVQVSIVSSTGEALSESDTVNFKVTSTSPASSTTSTSATTTDDSKYSISDMLWVIIILVVAVILFVAVVRMRAAKAK